jgi:hypothetical protein
MTVIVKSQTYIPGLKHLKCNFGGGNSCAALTLGALRCIKMSGKMGRTLHLTAAGVIIPNEGKF